MAADDLTERPRPAWGSAIALLALVAAIALGFSDVLSPDRGLMFRDHTLVFRPRWMEVVRMLLEGEWPARTFASPSGVPLEQMLNATWTPATLLLLLGRIDVVYDLFVIAHVAWLGVGVWSLARALGATREAALLAAGAGALAGPTVSSENLFVMLQGLAWVPWVGLGLTRTWRAQGRLPLAAIGGTALAFGFHVQGLTPAVLVLDLAAAGALLLVLRPHARALGVSAAAAALGLAVGAVELMPVLEALGQSARGQGFDAEVRGAWAVHGPMALELFVPSFWAPPEQPSINVPWATRTTVDPPYFTTLYLGTLLPVLVAGGLAGRARKALGALALLFALVALGPHTPLHGWLTSLPLLSSSRYPVKYTLCVVAALLPLLALALPRIADNPRRLVLAALVHLGVLVAIEEVVRAEVYLDLLQSELQPLRNGIVFEGLRLADLAAQLQALQWARVLTSAMAAAAMVGLALAYPRLGRKAPFALAAVVLVDLALGARATVHGADLERAKLPPRTEAALRDDPGRHWLRYTAGRLVVPHVEGATYFDDMVTELGRRGHYLHPISQRFEDLDLDGQSSPLHQRSFQMVAATPPPELWRLLARAGVSNLLSPDPLPLERVDSWAVTGGPEQHRYRLPDPTPRMSARARWTSLDPSVAGTPRHRVELARPEIDAVVLDPRVASSTTACPRPPTLQVQARDSEGGEATLEAACPTLVVLQEPLLEGWSARIDGAPQAVLPVDVGYVGVLVPPGRHHVRIELAGRSAFWRGVSGLAGGVALALVAAGLLLARRARDP